MTEARQCQVNLVTPHPDQCILSQDQVLHQVPHLVKVLRSPRHQDSCKSSTVRDQLSLLGTVTFVWETPTVTRNPCSQRSSLLALSVEDQVNAIQTVPTIPTNLQ